MPPKNNALTVFSQIISNRKADASGNPTATSCWTTFSDHIDWLFDTNGFGSTDKTQNLAGTAIMALKTSATVSVAFPDGTSGGGVVTADDFSWIASVIELLDDAGVWVEPKGNSISYNALQSISYNMKNKQNESTLEAADDTKATYY